MLGNDLGGLHKTSSEQSVVSCIDIFYKKVL